MPNARRGSGPAAPLDVVPTSQSALPLSDYSLGTHAGSGRLKGKRVLIVGGGQRKSGPAPEVKDAAGNVIPVIGNGRAVSLLAAREGASVAVADRDASLAKETADLCQREHGASNQWGSRHVSIQVDATDEREVERMLAEAVQKLGGKLDGIVCNVGAAWGGGLGGTSVELWERTMATNLKSHFLVLKHCRKHLNSDASIILISSTAAISPGSGYPAYHASKAGLKGLLLHAASELSNAGLRIRVNTVLPGLIDTPLGRVGSSARPERARTGVPLGRQGTGWDVAWAVSWLLSGESSYITGIELIVDGGLSSIAPRGVPTKL
ncbi:short-chain dehydrogenase/reductase SDR [Hyaloraphidium curvatum]|nr:short-chain dehydrogenase/reductase SDR [Hyaloraphidium curvatum]